MENGLIYPHQMRGRAREREEWAFYLYALLFIPLAHLSSHRSSGLVLPMAGLEKALCWAHPSTREGVLRTWLACMVPRSSAFTAWSPLCSLGSSVRHPEEKHGCTRVHYWMVMLMMSSLLTAFVAGKACMSCGESVHQFCTKSPNSLTNANLPFLEFVVYYFPSRNLILTLRWRYFKNVTRPAWM